MTTIYHGTPMTPRAALEAMADRSFCVSYYRPDDMATVDRIADGLMLDNGAFSFWMAARKTGCEADEKERNWSSYYAWAERWQAPKRFAIIPDAIAMPSQINDALINDWPLGDFGAPVWHMDGPISRLGRLCERWPLVCLGWVAQSRADNVVGSPAYHQRMAEVAVLMGNNWHRLHMLRGVAVAFDYPFRQRRQHQLGAKWVETRQPDRHDAWRPVARQASLRRPFGRKAA
jgi:hypothetical protein